MGLSNEERTEKIFFSVWRMTRPERFDSLAKYPELLELLRRLWSTLLARKSNGLYWILGSGVGNEIMDKPSLFNTAIIGNKYRDEPDNLQQMTDERIAEIEAMPDSPEKTALLEKARLIEFQCCYRPTFQSILLRNAPELASIYEIYEECEHIRYALNRYDDEFSAGLSELDALICNILGNCFNYFTTDSRFREAWYTWQISNRLVYLRVDETSVVVRFWASQHLQHAVGIGVHDLDELHAKWAVIQQKQTLTSEEAILTTLWLLKRRFHYDHELNALLELLRKHNREHPKDKVNLNKVKALFLKHNKQAHDKYEDSGLAPVEFCRLSEKTVARNWKHKPAKKPAVKKKRRK